MATSPVAGKGNYPMAVRHDVENLIRRGNIFYWRARVPSSFARCQPGSRLSLSLHCSDHKKAEVIGRKLNTLMAELKMKSKEPMSKAQLQKLCEHERDVMLLHLEDVSIVARRYGRPADIEELELDLENGWAYKLLAMFGIRQKLTLEEGCSGSKYLLENGVPASHIFAIRSNYLELLHEANTRGFQDGIRMLMHQFDISQNPLNHEKAMKAYFSGRAEALFDVAERHSLADRNLSELTGGSRPDPQPVANAQATEVVMPPAPLIAIPVDVAPTPKPPEPFPIAVLDLSPSPRHAAIERDDGLKTQPVIQVADFEAECEQLVKNMKDAWDDSTARDARALVRMFKTVLEEYGIEHTGQISQYHIGKLRQHFNNIPIRWGQSAKMRAMSAPELRAEGQRLREQAETEGKEAAVGLSAATIRKHFGNLNHFLKHVRGHGFELDDWSFEGLRPKKPKAGSVRKQQHKPTPDEIKPIFSCPVYTGSLDHDRGRKKPGLHVFHDAAYFLPLLYTYLGGRRKEFAGLSLNDIEEDDDGPVLVLRSNEFRRLKTEQSERLLPLPDELIRLGFMDYCVALHRLGYKAVFPDLISHKTRNDPGDRFYDVFNPIMQEALGTKMWKRAFHALRHSMADTLKQAGVSTEVIDDISGRLSDGSETNTRYTNPAGLPLMREALGKYPIITSEIEAKPIKLLPWIEQQLPPPWARDAKTEARRRK
ncbi:tyrosine-type recombinase/integrase [Rhizobium leguminosarum]|uniref:tyrosine-type recombinase/integrase n=1 Tax=Rhizobium leguminosarum TaxID=384 RepID=UPI001F394214|nr:tyrosine-type recombinase/integrase [Rhizobium leguminosarum]UIK18325.1 tyrosine-type recombinase/integrase [Rhizobium leguminosarum]